MAMRIKRTATPDNPPSGLEEGQLSVEMAGPFPKLWIGVPTSIDPSGRRLVSPSEATMIITPSHAGPPVPLREMHGYWNPGTGMLYFWYADAWRPVVSNPPGHWYIDGRLQCSRIDVTPANASLGTDGNIWLSGTINNGNGETWSIGQPVAIVSPTAPLQININGEPPQEGALWFDSDEGTLLIRFQDQWIEV